MKRYIFTALAAVSALALVGCDEEARIASQNLSTAADNFKMARRVTVLHDGKPVLVVQGMCSQEGERIIRVICKTDAGAYRKTIISAADRDTVLSEQQEALNVSGYRYKVTINPAQALPDFELR